MHLTLTSPAAPHSTDPHTIAVSAPGITIGSDPNNDWIPDRDPRNLCAVQAAIRVENGVYTLVNLASRLPVTVNGATLACQSSARLQPGDDISLGACRVTTQAAPDTAPSQPVAAEAAPYSTQSDAAEKSTPTSVAAATAVLPAVVAGSSAPAAHAVSVSAPLAETALRQAEPAPLADLPAPSTEAVTPDATPAAAAADADPFADLLGPGTLPLGAAPSLDTTHPFDMASAAPRNAADPLAGWEKRPDEAQTSRARDPLDLFEANASEEVPDVFTDHTPSVLDRESRKRS